MQKMVSLAEKRCAAQQLQAHFGASERRACRVLQLPRSTKRRQTRRREEAELVSRIHALSEQYPRYGYRKIHTLLHREGWRVGRERVRVIRRREGLRVIKKSRKKRPFGHSTSTLRQAEYPNHVWSYDFVHDQTADGRTLKCLTVVDEYTREGLMIDADRSITAGDVIRVLGWLFAVYGAPACIQSDNGPELVAHRLQAWLKQQGIGTRYIDPGSPWQNGHNESFNAVFRDGCLDRWEFYSVAEARRVIDQWLYEYNHIRPHGALNNKTPAAFAAECRQQQHKVA